MNSDQNVKIADVVRKNTVHKFFSETRISRIITTVLPIFFRPVQSLTSKLTNVNNLYLLLPSLLRSFYVFITNLLRVACWKKYGTSKSFNNTHLETKW